MVVNQYNHPKSRERGEEKMGSVKVPEMPQRDEQRLWVTSLRPLAAIALRFLGRSSDASWKASSYFIFFPCGCLDVSKLKREKRSGKKEREEGRKSETEEGGGVRKEMS